MDLTRVAGWALDVLFFCWGALGAAMILMGLSIMGRELKRRWQR